MKFWDLVEKCPFSRLKLVPTFYLNIFPGLGAKNLKKSDKNRLLTVLRSFKRFLSTANRCVHSFRRPIPNYW